MTASPGLFRSALIVSVARAVNVVLALALGVLSARYFGAGYEKDCYLVAQSIPTLLTTVLLGGLYSSTLITLAEVGSRGGAAAQFAFARRLLHILGIVLLPCATIVLARPVWIVRSFAPGFDAARVHLVSHLLVLTTVSSLLGLAYIVVRCLFEVRGLYTTTCLLYLIVPFASLAGLIVLRERIGVFALAAGPLLGLCPAVLILAIVALRTLPDRTASDTPDALESAATVRRFWTGLGPMSLAANAGQINLLVDNAFASALAAGSITMLGFALAIVSNAEFLTSLSLAEVVFPRLNAASLRGPRELGEALKTSSRFMLLMTAPLSFGALTFGVPVARLLFERGRFGPDATLAVGEILACFSLEIVVMGYQVLFSRALLARRRLAPVVWVSLAAIAGNAVLDALLMIPLGARGIALATTITAVVHVALLVPLIRREAALHYERQDWLFLGRVAASAGAMGMAVLLWSAAFERLFSVAGEMARLAEVGLGLLIGAAVYGALLRLFRIEEAGAILRRLLVSLGFLRLPGVTTPR